MKYNQTILLVIISLISLMNIKAVFALDRGTGMVGSNHENNVAIDDTLSDGIPPGFILIEGDILVPEDFFTAEGAYQTNLWTNNKVFYEFDSNVFTMDRTRMQTAMKEWEDISDVRFIQCPGNSCSGNETNYLHIQDSNRNASSVGMIGGEQFVLIFNWNFRFIMAHELGHALGYWHEHQRDDRDDFVEIHQGNVDPTQCNASCFTNNFVTAAPDNYGPYDFDSVMHYDECSFAYTPCPCADPANCETIEVSMSCDTLTGRCTNEASKGRSCTTDLDCDPRLIGICNTRENSCIKGRVGQLCFGNIDCNINIGQRDHLSKFDALVMSFLYADPDWRFIDISFTGTELGTFLEPFKTFNAGVSDLPSGGTLVIQPGNYNAVGTYTEKMTWMGPVGGVALGN